MREFLRKHRELILYGICGVPTVASNFITYFVLAALNISTAVCAFVAMMVSIVVAYVINKIWVFHSRKSRKLEVFKEFVSFLSCRLLSGSVEVVIMVVFVDICRFVDYEPMIKLGATAVVVILNYLASKKIIFREET